MFWNRGCQRTVPGSVAPASGAVNLLEMQILDSPEKPTKSETLGQGPAAYVLTSSLSDSDGH